MRNNRRGQIMKEEVALFKQVLQHPDYQTHGVKAIQQHIKNATGQNNI